MPDHEHIDGGKSQLEVHEAPPAETAAPAVKPRRIQARDSKRCDISNEPLDCDVHEPAPTFLWLHCTNVARKLRRVIGFYDHPEVVKCMQHGEVPSKLLGLDE